MGLREALFAQLQRTLAHLVHVKAAFHNSDDGIVALIQDGIGKSWKSYKMQ